MMHATRRATALLAILAAAAPAAAETLQQTISRENVLFNCAGASLTVGRDGRIRLHLPEAAVAPFRAF